MEKYGLLQKYNFPYQFIDRLEAIINKSAKNSNKKTVLQLNNLLIGNEGNLDEIESLGQDLFFMAEFISVINNISRTLKDFKYPEELFECSDQSLMETMVRVGNATQSRFSNSVALPGTFNKIIEHYIKDVTSMKYDCIQDEEIRKYFLIGFVKWYDNNSLMQELVMRVIDNERSRNNHPKPLSNKRKVLFKYNNGVIYEDDTFSYGLETFQGYNESKKMCTTKKEYFSKNWTLDQAFTELSREFGELFEVYKNENNLKDSIFDQMDKYLYCCTVGQNTWGKYNPLAKNTNLVIGEGIGNFFEVDEKDKEGK